MKRETTPSKLRAHLLGEKHRATVDAKTTTAGRGGKGKRTSPPLSVEVDLNLLQGGKGIENCGWLEPLGIFQAIFEAAACLGSKFHQYTMGLDAKMDTGDATRAAISKAEACVAEYEERNKGTTSGLFRCFHMAIDAWRKVEELDFSEDAEEILRLAIGGVSACNAATELADMEGRRYLERLCVAAAEGAKTAKAKGDKAAFRQFKRQEKTQRKAARALDVWRCMHKAGMTAEQTAEQMGVSKSTVERLARRARELMGAPKLTPGRRKQLTSGKRETGKAAEIALEHGNAPEARGAIDRIRRGQWIDRRDGDAEKR